MSDDSLTLTVDGMNYKYWTEVTATRSIDRCVGGFDIAVSEAWEGATKESSRPWQVKPYAKCVLSLGGQKALTGAVDEYLPGFSATSHGVRITGRSKTADVVDCTPELKGGQFSGYRLDAIARAVCQPFGVGVVVETDMGPAFPDATIQRDETAFAFVERLCRLRGVLATDDADGRLVLTRAGARQAAGALVQGHNILEASAEINVTNRFSKYVVRAQRPIVSETDEVETEIYAEAADKGVPRYRPHASLAESQLDRAGAKARANWQASYAAGRSTQARVTVQGWHQDDGRLWAINELIPLKSTYLAVDMTLLIASVTFRLDANGRRTELLLGPVAGYTPDPGEVKLKKTKAGKGGTSDSWAGAGGVP